MERFAIKIDERVKLNLYNICRLCGIDNRDQVPIIDEPDKTFIHDDEPSLCKKIVDCVGIQVDSTDKMPQKICTLCVDKISDFYEYREMCKVTNIQTRELLGLPPEIIKDEKPSLELITPQVLSNQPFAEISGQNVKRKRKLKSECINYEEIDDEEIEEKPPKKKFPKNLVGAKSKKLLSPRKIIVKRESVKSLPSRILPVREKAIPVLKEKPTTLVKEKLTSPAIKEKDVTVKPKVSFVKEKLQIMKEKGQPSKEKLNSTKEKPVSVLKDKTPLLKEKTVPLKEKAQMDKEKIKLVKEKVNCKLPILKEKLLKEKTAAKEKLIPLREGKEPASSKIDTELITLKTPNRRERQRELETKKKRKIQIIPPVDKVKTENLYACIVCPKDFKTQPEYDIHFFREHTPNTLEHGCSACREAFYDLQEYRDHQLWHRLSSFPFSCFKCSSSFDRITAYTRHFLTSCVPHIEYNVVDDIKCQKCQKTFVTKNLYDWHGCLIKNNSKCPRCNKFFAKRLHLQRHVVMCNDIVTDQQPLIAETRTKTPLAVEPANFTAITSNDGKKIVKQEPGSILEIEDESHVEVPNSNDDDDHEMEDNLQNDVGFQDDNDEEEDDTSINVSTEIDNSSHLNKDSSDIITIQDEDESTVVRPIKQEKVDRRYDEVICRLPPSDNIPMVQIKQEMFNTDYNDQVDVNILRNIKPEPVDCASESAERVPEPVKGVSELNSSKDVCSVVNLPECSNQMNKMAAAVKPTLKLKIKKEHGTLNSSFIDSDLGEGGDSSPNPNKSNDDELGSSHHRKKRNKHKKKIYKIPRQLALIIKQEKQSRTDLVEEITIDQNEDDTSRITVPVISGVTSMAETELESANAADQSVYFEEEDPSLSVCFPSHSGPDDPQNEIQMPVIAEVVSLKQTEPRLPLISSVTSLSQAKGIRVKMEFSNFSSPRPDSCETVQDNQIEQDDMITSNFHIEYDSVADHMATIDSVEVALSNAKDIIEPDIEQKPNLEELMKIQTQTSTGIYAELQQETSSDLVSSIARPEPTEKLFEMSAARSEQSEIFSEQEVYPAAALLHLEPSGILSKNEKPAAPLSLEQSDEISEQDHSATALRSEQTENLSKQENHLASSINLTTNLAELSCLNDITLTVTEVDTTSQISTVTAKDDNEMEIGTCEQNVTESQEKPDSAELISIDLNKTDGIENSANKDNILECRLEIANIDISIETEPCNLETKQDHGEITKVDLVGTDLDNVEKDEVQSQDSDRSEIDRLHNETSFQNSMIEATSSGIKDNNPTVVKPTETAKRHLEIDDILVVSNSKIQKLSDDVAITRESSSLPSAFIAGEIIQPIPENSFIINSKNDELIQEVQHEFNYNSEPVNLLKEYSQLNTTEPDSENDLLVQPPANISNINSENIVTGNETDHLHTSESPSENDLMAQPPADISIINSENIVPGNERDHLYKAEPSFKNDLMVQPPADISIINSENIVPGNERDHLYKAEPSFKNDLMVQPPADISIINSENIVPGNERDHLYKAEPSFKNDLMVQPPADISIINSENIVPGNERDHLYKAEPSFKNDLMVQPAADISIINSENILPGNERDQLYKAEPSFKNALMVQPAADTSIINSENILPGNERDQIYKAEPSFKNDLMVQPPADISIINSENIVPGNERDHLYKAEPSFKNDLMVQPPADISIINSENIVPGNERDYLHTTESSSTTDLIVQPTSNISIINSEEVENENNHQHSIERPSETDLVVQPTSDIYIINSAKLEVENEKNHLHSIEPPSETDLVVQPTSNISINNSENIVSKNDVNNEIICEVQHDNNLQNEDNLRENLQYNLISHSKDETHIDSTSNTITQISEDLVVESVKDRELRNEVQYEVEYNPVLNKETTEKVMHHDTVELSKDIDNPVSDTPENYEISMQIENAEIQSPQVIRNENVEDTSSSSSNDEILPHHSIIQSSTDILTVNSEDIVLGLEKDEIEHDKIHCDIEENKQERIHDITSSSIDDIYNPTIPPATNISITNMDDTSLASEINDDELMEVAQNAIHCNTLLNKDKHISDNELDTMSSFEDDSDLHLSTLLSSTHILNRNTKDIVSETENNDKLMQTLQNKKYCIPFLNEETLVKDSQPNIPSSTEHDTSINQFTIPVTTDILTRNIEDTISETENYYNLLQNNKDIESTRQFDTISSSDENVHLATNSPQITDSSETNTKDIVSDKENSEMIENPLLNKDKREVCDTRSEDKYSEDKVTTDIVTITTAEIILEVEKEDELMHAIHSNIVINEEKKEEEGQYDDNSSSSSSEDSSNPSSPDVLNDVKIINEVQFVSHSEPILNEDKLERDSHYYDSLSSDDDMDKPNSPEEISNSSTDNEISTETSKTDEFESKTPDKIDKECGTVPKHDTPSTSEANINMGTATLIFDEEGHVADVTKADEMIGESISKEEDNTTVTIHNVIIEKNPLELIMSTEVSSHTKVLTDKSDDISKQHIFNIISENVTTQQALKQEESKCNINQTGHECNFTVHNEELSDTFELNIKNVKEISNRFANENEMILENKVDYEMQQDLHNVESKDAHLSSSELKSDVLKDNIDDEIYPDVQDNCNKPHDCSLNDENFVKNIFNEINEDEKLQSNFNEDEKLPQKFVEHEKLPLLDEDVNLPHFIKEKLPQNFDETPQRGNLINEINEISDQSCLSTEEGLHNPDNIEPTSSSINNENLRTIFDNEVKKPVEYNEDIISDSSDENRNIKSPINEASNMEIPESLHQTSVTMDFEEIPSSSLKASQPQVIEVVEFINTSTLKIDTVDQINQDTSIQSLAVDSQTISENISSEPVQESILISSHENLMNSTNINICNIEENEDDIDSDLEKELLEESMDK